MSQINWRRLEEDAFNSAVEALLVRHLTTNGLRAQAIDGRGGDRGIDIDVRVEATGQLTHILQLKHFPEGFSGGFLPRRRQIKESFEQAMKEQPPVWTLVVPRNPTLQERRSVHAMRKGRKVIIRIMAAAELDGILSDHPGIEKYLSRNDAIEVLREVNRPEAALAQPDDLRREVERLQSRLDGRSEYWATMFRTEPDGGYVETWYAKRPDAVEREPLSISLSTQFGPEHEDLRRQFDEKMKYGGSGELVLPPEVVSELRQEGPEWFRGTSTGAEVHILPIADHEPQRVRLEVFTAAGARAAAITGKTTLIDRGYGGGTIETAVEGGLQIRWRFAHEAEEGGNVSFAFDPTGATAHEARRALRFTSSLMVGAAIRMSVGEYPSFQINLDDEPTFGPEPALVEFVEDLCWLEEHFDVALRFPAEGAHRSDQLWARVLVRILRGEPTPMPGTESFSATLNGERSEGVDMLLRKGAAIVISHPEWGIEIFGEVLRIGNVYIYTGVARADDSAELLKAYDAGTAADRKLVVRPSEGQPFLIYAPDYMSNDPDTRVLAHPWNATGIPEHSGLSSLPNAAPLVSNVKASSREPQDGVGGGTAPSPAGKSSEDKDLQPLG